MKPFFAFLVMLFLNFIGHAQIEQWRKTYFNLGTTEGKKKYIEALKTSSPSNAIEKAYKGVAIAMAAEFESSVNKKFAVFGEGKNMIEEAVRLDFYNPEIRFLRFSIQSEVPWIVQYKDKIEEDYWRIIGAFDAGMADPGSEFWQKAIAFMMRSDELNAVLKEKLKAYQS